MKDLRFLVALLGVFLVFSGNGIAQENQVTNRIYRIGSDFLFPGDGGGAAPSDPFAAEPAPQNQEPVKDLQQFITDELGIEFPEGTWLRHDPRTGRMEIQHIPAVVEAIEAYFEALTYGEKSVNIRAEIYQVPAAVALRLQQFCGPLDDHSAALRSAMTMAERGEGQVVATATVIARSGQRAKVEDKNELIYPTEVDWDKDNETVLPYAFETRDYGTILEVDPVLGPDDFTIDLNFALEHHTAPPTMRSIAVTSPKNGRKVVVEFPEFHCKKVITQLTLADGTVKLVGAWRPTGKPEYEASDVMQIAFLRADIVTKQSMVRLPGSGGQQ